MRKLPSGGAILLAAPAAALAGAATGIVQDQCGPFTDASPAICPYVLEMYVLGITAGTSPTTYSPDATVTRGQAAVLVSKGVNQAIARSSLRAALGQWWTTTPPRPSTERESSSRIRISRCLCTEPPTSLHSDTFMWEPVYRETSAATV
jgi:hypothetical protein